MPKGKAQRVLIAGMDELAQLITSLTSDEAIALGTLRPDLPDTVRITTKSLHDRLNGSAPPDLIARTAENIVFNADHPALTLIDLDLKGMPETVKGQLAELGGFWGALTTIVPALAGVSHLIRSLTSAGLYHKDTGEKFAGSGGLHAYIPILDGTDTERFLKTLHERCWLAGLGWMMVGAGGQLLERSIIDRMVGAPERLVFEGAPILDPPLAQDIKSRAPNVREGDTLNTKSACPQLNMLEIVKYRELRANMERRLAPERDKARSAFINSQTKRLVERSGLDGISARQVIERQCEGILLQDIVLPFDDPVLAGTTVADVLAHPDSFAGENLADPLEGVEYGAGKAKILLRKDGTPWIHSFAHGRTIYELRTAEPRHIVQVIGGRLPLVIDAGEAALIECDAEIFERNGMLVYLGRDEPAPNHFAPHARRISFAYEPGHLADHWTRHVDFQKFDTRSKTWRPIDCPDKVGAAYLQRKGRRHLRRLRAVISAPTLRSDGSILDKPGYDAETGLFYDPCGVEYPEVPLNPSQEQVKAALKLLIKPIGLFPFVDDSSRSVTLSGILTATIRASLLTAPLHASTAPVAGPANQCSTTSSRSSRWSGHVIPSLKRHKPKNLRSGLPAH